MLKQSKIKVKENKCYQSWIKYKESMKPSGLCTKCPYVNECKVDTQSNAKLIQCVYRVDFGKDKGNHSHKKNKRS
jgi:hypothetical protein